MATYTHTPTHAGHRLAGDRTILTVLAILVAAAVAVAAGLLVDWSFIGGGDDAADTVGPSYETLDHAARVAEASRQMHALQNVTVAVPTMAPELAEDIATLELVVTGQLPIEAAETMPVETTRPDALTGPDLRIEQGRPDTRTGVDLRFDLEG